MCEQRQLLTFEPSYTLDVLCFLDLIFTDVLTREDELITHFEELLSSDCSRIVKNARKRLPKQETFMSLMVPLITADSEFNGLRLSELFGSPKYLTTQIKKHHQYKQLPKPLKKFINRDAQWVIAQLATVVSELEKAKFKTFWIEQRLPLIKHKMKQYEKEILPLQVIENLNDWLIPNVMNERTVYLLSFYEGNPVQLLNHQIMSSIHHASVHIIQVLVDQVFSTVNVESELKLLAKELKKNSDFLHAYQAVKGEYKQGTAYLEKNICLAFTTYFYQTFKVLDQPYQYLGRYNFGTHKMSILFYQYIQSHFKESNQSFNDYLLNMTQEVELENFENQVLDIMNQHL